LRPLLQRSGWNDELLAPGVGEQMHVDELGRKERVVVVVEHCLEPHGARRLIDLIVDGDDGAAGQPRGASAIEGVHGQRRTGTDARQHGAESVLRQAEHDRDRFNLRDDHEAGAGTCADDVAGVDQPETDASADRSRDPRIGQVQAGAVDGCLVDLQRGSELCDRRGLRIHVLSGDRVFAEQRLVAREVHPRVRELRLIARQLPLRLLELHLEGSRIDLGQEVAPVDELAFAEQDPHELSVHAGPHRYGVERDDRTECGKPQRQVGTRGSRDRHRHRWRSVDAPSGCGRFDATRRREVKAGWTSRHPKKDANERGTNENDRHAPREGYTRKHADLLPFWEATRAATNRATGTIDRGAGKISGARRDGSGDAAGRVRTRFGFPATMR
jgi:hypothetical protein